jgi:hypothetical protein
MKYKLFTLIITAMTITNSLIAQQLDFSKVKSFEHQLDDVMEIIDTTELKVKLIEVEKQFQKEPNEINKIRLGIIYHETALNLSFFSRTEYKGYAKKSYDQLSDLNNSVTTTKELMPFIASYRASALSLVSAETKKLNLLGQAFTLFGDAVNKYSEISYLPEFLRGSVAENLPWIFFTKRKFVKKDFQSIIDKQEQKDDFANWKIMSFTYWAWANQHQGKKYRSQAILFLDKAISLDPNYKAGRKRAEELKTKLIK